MKFWFATALTLMSPWAAEAQSEIPTAIDAFVQSHCAECHRGDDPAGGLDSVSLSLIFRTKKRLDDGSSPMIAWLPVKCRRRRTADDRR